MARTIRVQSDSNAHDRPWRVAVEQGFFADEELDVVYNEDNPQGSAGRVKDFGQRWKESQLQQGALEVYPVCEWGAIERVHALGKGKIIGLDATVRTAAKLLSALNRAIEWLRANEERSRAELLRDLEPQLRKDGLLPELTGVKSYQPAEFNEKVDWMRARGFLDASPTYEEVVRSK